MVVIKILFINSDELNLILPSRVMILNVQLLTTGLKKMNSFHCQLSFDLFPKKFNVLLRKNCFHCYNFFYCFLFPASLILMFVMIPAYAIISLVCTDMSLSVFNYCSNNDSEVGIVVQKLQKKLLVPEIAD